MKPLFCLIAYWESPALWMSWNKQSRPTMGQSWPDTSLLSPTDRQSVEAARRETRRLIIVKTVILLSLLSDYGLLHLTLFQLQTVISYLISCF